MCGIVGIASRTAGIRPELLSAMRDTMAHRGPDDAGAWWSADGRVGLAQRRLAVVDLTPSGHQPMSDFQGKLWITYNGEIYNHKDLRSELEGVGQVFRTSSDTEVVLAAYRAWGVDCLSRLNGMFSFALFDTDARSLFLARDRAGEKPLFYRHSPGRFSFASELKALMADPALPRVLDPDSLECFLAYGYVPGERCILKGVRKLPQGHAAIYDLEADRLRVWRYWQLPEPTDRVGIDEEELLRRLDGLLEDSVRRQLEADVPVGILLSGGMDSSLVTAMAARVAGKRVKTFTITFPGHGSFDEADHARLIANHFGTDHTELPAEPASFELMPELARQYDEPMADSSMIPTYLVSRLIRRHATVALGGDGGDELFGGYPHYVWLSRRQRYRSFITGPLERAASAISTRMFPVGLRGRNHFIGLGGGISRSIAHVNLYFDRYSRDRLLPRRRHEGPGSARSPEAYKEGLCNGCHSPLRQMTEADFRSYLVDQILVKVDRASMLASLEVRAPWLDHRIVEFAFGEVPDSLRATRRDRKVLSSRLAERLLPAGFDPKRKQGFSMPLMEWFKGKWGEYVEGILREAPPDLFDRSFLEELVAAQRRGHGNTQRMFALAIFELWRKEYRVTY